MTCEAWVLLTARAQVQRLAGSCRIRPRLDGAETRLSKLTARSSHNDSYADLLLAPRSSLGGPGRRRRRDRWHEPDRRQRQRRPALCRTSRRSSCSSTCSRRRSTPSAAPSCRRPTSACPTLPGVGGGSSDTSLTSLISGTHTLQVWASGPDKQRLAIHGTLGETDLIRNGTDVWNWSSQDNTATHTTLSSAATRAAGRPTELPCRHAERHRSRPPPRRSPRSSPTTPVTTDRDGEGGRPGRVRPRAHPEGCPAR